MIQKQIKWKPEQIALIDAAVEDSAVFGSFSAYVRYWALEAAKRQLEPDLGDGE